MVRGTKLFVHQYLLPLVLMKKDTNREMVWSDGSRNNTTLANPSAELSSTHPLHHLSSLTQRRIQDFPLGEAPTRWGDDL